MRNLSDRNLGSALGAAGFLLTTLVLMSGCGAHGEDSGTMAPPEVDVAEVLVEPVTVWETFTGQVAAPETVELRPRVSGYIDEVAFEEGALVKAGDLLFRIDPRPYRAREQAASADLAQARSQLEQTQSEAKRAEQLLASRAISREEYDQRRTALSGARARVDAAQAALESARLELDYTQIKAPVDGRVGRAMVTKGNLASADQTLLTTLVSVNPMYVYFEPDEQTAISSQDLLADGGHAPVRVALADEDGFAHQGELNFIDNQMNASTGTLQYRAVLPNPDGRLRPGQFARVQMPVERLDSALLVNRKAVVTNQDRRLVYVVDDANKVQPRQVTLGHDVGELLVVEDGLDPGDRVIVKGQLKVFGAGMQVEPHQVAMRSESSVAATTVASIDP